MINNVNTTIRWTLFIAPHDFAIVSSEFTCPIITQKNIKMQISFLGGILALVETVTDCGATFKNKSPQPLLFHHHTPMPMGRAIFFLLERAGTKPHTLRIMALRAIHSLPSKIIRPSIASSKILRCFSLEAHAESNTPGLDTTAAAAAAPGEPKLAEAGTTVATRPTTANESILSIWQVTKPWKMHIREVIIIIIIKHSHKKNTSVAMLICLPISSL
jgi:hypothetical protein